MRVLVCGGRNFRDGAWLRHVLDGLYAQRPFSLVIDGGARGADTLAYEWATGRGVPTATFHADWTALGGRAGPIRNQQMLDEGKPDLVIAFPGRDGTADMVRRAKTAGVQVLEPTRGRGA